MPDRRKSYLETFCRCDFRLKTANRAVEANFDHFLIQENQEIAIGIFLEAVLGFRVRYDRSDFFLVRYIHGAAADRAGSFWEASWWSCHTAKRLPRQIASFGIFLENGRNILENGL